MSLQRYLLASYRDGARGEVVDGVEWHDCWSMARAARVELYGRCELPSWAGEYRHDPDGFTGNYRAQAAAMTEVAEPVPGAVIAVLRKRSGACVHVALVVENDGALCALDIEPKRGARLRPLARFLADSANQTIKYYDDPNLS